MKNARLFFALLLVGGAAACTADSTGPLPAPPRNSILMGSGYDTPPDTTKQSADTTKQGG